MPYSANNWPALESGSPLLTSWVVPTKEGAVYLKLRQGSAGFLLCHFVLWWADTIEPVFGKLLDDWGWAWRPIRGQVTGLSNHASGTAVDINATRHPLGTRTLSAKSIALILTRVAVYRGTLRWGGQYNGRVDQMHVEINADLSAVEKRARALMDSPRGKRILAANPRQRAVILS